MKDNILDQVRFDVMNADCLDALRNMPDCSVDAIVTDPPYGLSFMGKKWDYDVPSADVWRECLRVLKPGGYLLSFAGTRTQHRMACNIEDAGFEIRDMIAWVYGSGFNKVGYIRNKDGQHVTQGFGGALKPALEPITMARKPLDGTLVNNMITHGTGGLNIDGCRVEGAGPSGLKPYTRSTSPEVYALGMAKEGREVTYTDHPFGRWPANFIHSGEDEVLALFPVTKPSNSKPRNNGEFKSVAKGRDAPHTTFGHDGNGGSAARFFYCAKANKKDRGEANIHPTVKPTDLMRYLCRLITPPDGVILDPFMGSGSTGKAAMLEGFRFIGIEQSSEYFAIACARINSAISDTSSDKRGG